MQKKKHLMKYLITFIIICVSIISYTAAEQTNGLLIPPVLNSENGTVSNGAKTLVPNPPDIMVPILNYHHLDPDGTRTDGATITPLQFEEDMLTIKAMGYETINFTQLIDYYSGNSKLPANPIIITFDDGYSSNYLYAFPILKQLNMKATISVIGWSIGKSAGNAERPLGNSHFSMDEAVTMVQSGLIDIQYHTYDMHNDGSSVENPRKGTMMLSGETPADYMQRFEEDTLKLQQILQEKIKNDTLVFAYPYGAYNAYSEQILKKSGFKVTMTSEYGINHTEDGLYLMKRIPRYNGVSSLALFTGIQRLKGECIPIPFGEISSQEVRVEKLREMLRTETE